MTYTLTRKTYLAANGIPVLIDSNGGLAGMTHGRFATLPGGNETFANFVFRKLTGQDKAGDDELRFDEGEDERELGFRYILGVPEVPRNDVTALLSLLAQAGFVPQGLRPLVAPRHVIG
jgi:hypothetical protein